MGCRDAVCGVQKHRLTLLAGSAECSRANGPGSVHNDKRQCSGARQILHGSQVWHYCLMRRTVAENHMLGLLCGSVEANASNTAPKATRKTHLRNGSGRSKS